MGGGGARWRIRTQNDVQLGNGGSWGDKRKGARIGGNRPRKKAWNSGYRREHGPAKEFEWEDRLPSANISV